MKRALITGVSGQDGCYLTKLLIEKGYKVFGTIRRVSSYTNLWRLADLGLFDQITLIPADMTDSGSLHRALQESYPDEIYNLAAMSFVQASFSFPVTTMNIDATGVVSLLESVRVFNKSLGVDPSSTKVYQASSTEMFGNSGEEKNDENSPMLPASPYGAAKLFSHHIARMYREAYGMFVVSGILSNHESRYRGVEFVTRRISNYVGMLATGFAKEPLTLGNIEAIRDFGHAPEYVEAMVDMLQQNSPDDYVIATGVGHSVADFAKVAFEFIGKDWKNHVEISEDQKRPFDIWKLVGNPAKARERLGWQHRTDFDKLVAEMVVADLKRWERFGRGEIFPWDMIPTR